MRALSLLAFPALAAAQYFSAGWQPGQPISDVPDTPAATGIPTAEHQTVQPKSLSELFSVNTLLTSSPVASIFSRFGINITERVALANTNPWDERIPLITDDNYEDLVVNEPLTEQEEKDRVWVAVISVTTAKQDGVSKYLDMVFDSAYNETFHANDLPNVRWGRIDYLNVTYVTTKWNVWQAPYLVVITNRGRDLRFYKPHQLRLRDKILREFLLTEGWKNTPVWTSRYAPGGDREWVLDLVAKSLTKIYNLLILVPRWVLFVISGGLASVFINVLHRPSKKPREVVQVGSSKRPTPDTSSELDTSTNTQAIKPDPDALLASISTAIPSAPTPQKRAGRKKGKKQ